MSSIFSMAYLRQVSTMPPDSSWNTPIVSPRLRSSKVFQSSSETFSMAKSGVCLRMCCTASWMTVRFFSPRKSIFSRPTSVMALHVVLGDDFPFVAAGERDVFVERAVADHDAGGVDADVAGESFELGGVAPEFLIGGDCFR